MSLWMAFLMIPGHGPRLSKASGVWLGFGLLALCVLQILLFGELLGD